MNEFINALFLGAGYNAALVCIGAALFGFSAGAAGTFLVLRKRALACKAAANAMLPGIGLAFIVMALLGGDGKDTFGLMIGAAITAWLGITAIEWIARNTRLQEDAAIGAVLSVSFGVGIVLLTVIQSLGLGRPSGLEKLLTGSIAVMLYRDAVVIAVGGTLIFVITFLLRRHMTLVAFDSEYAAVRGYNVRIIDLTVLSLGVAITVVGLKIVGLVLVIALLIIPPVTARYWSNRPDHILLIASIVGATSAYVGAAISASAPDLPAGTVIVLVAAGIFIFSMLFSPERGLLAFAGRSWELRKYALTREALLALARVERIPSFSAYIILYIAGAVRRDRVTTDLGRKLIDRYALDERRWRVGETLNPDVDVAGRHCTFESIEKVFTRDQIVKIDRALRNIDRIEKTKQAGRERSNFNRIHAVASWPSVHDALQNVSILGYLLAFAAVVLGQFFDDCQDLISWLVKRAGQMMSRLLQFIIEIISPLKGLRNSVNVALLPAVVAGIVVTFGMFLMVTPRYSAQVQLEISTRQPSTLPIAGGADPLKLNRELIEAHVNAIKAPNLLLDVATSLQLHEKEQLTTGQNFLTLMLSQGNTTEVSPGAAEQAQASDEQILELILSSLKVFAAPENRYISIQFSSSDRRLAADFVYRLVSSYNQQLRDFLPDKTQSVPDELQLEISQLKEELQAAESALASVSFLNDQLIQPKNERSLAPDKWQTAKNANDVMTVEALSEFRNSPNIQRLVQQRIKTENWVIEARVLLPPTNPVRRQLNSDLQRLNRALQREISKIMVRLKNKFNYAGRRVEDIRDQISMHQSKGNAASDNVEILKYLDSTVQSKRWQLGRLQHRLEENSKLVEAAPLPVEIRMISPVRADADPVFLQKIAYTVLAGFAGFVIGLACVTIGNIIMSGSHLSLYRR